MAFLPAEDLGTHLYEEELSAIVREDETITATAIDTSIDIAKSYLIKDYDTETIFSATGDDRNAALLSILKDIAVWELITLANPSVYYEHRKFRYEQAKDWPKDVYKGMVTTLPKNQDEGNYGRYSKR